jgi:hypothetical protein
MTLQEHMFCSFCRAEITKEVYVLQTGSDKKYCCEACARAHGLII